MAFIPTPTTGLNVAAALFLSGTGVTNCTNNSGVNQYQVSLNVGASPNPATVALTATAKDVAGTTVSPSHSVVWKSYNTGVATVSAGTVTSVAKGQAVIEAQLPVFDNGLGNDASTGNPLEMIYVQCLVNVGA